MRNGWTGEVKRIIHIYTAEEGYEVGIDLKDTASEGRRLADRLLLSTLTHVRSASNITLSYTLHTCIPEKNTFCTLTCELDVELILGFEDLHIERAVWGKVLHGPGSENGLMVLCQRKTERKRGI